MFPSVKSVLSTITRWKKSTEPGHVVVGGFDGDATAWQLITDGYVDATGVQDVFFEVDAALQAIADAKAGKTPAPRIPDPGFVITQANRSSLEPRMWGAVVAKTSR
jgi:ABC-type sugar transport system substrate-binding protein